MNNNIPPEILNILMSKKKKLNHFIDKLNLLDKWVKDSQQDYQKFGLFIKNSNEIIINPVIISLYLDLEPRSVRKNLNLNGFSCTKTIEWKKWFLFTKITNLIPLKDKFELDPCWENLIKKNPNPNLKDFYNLFCSQNKRFITTFQLLELIYENQSFTQEIFNSILYHFGPLSSIDIKIQIISSSLFIRGWSFGDGIKKCNLIFPNIFEFNDGNKKIKLLNDFKIFQINNFWLKLEDNNYIEIEAFWEKNYPLEKTSIEQFQKTCFQLFTNKR